MIPYPITLILEHISELYPCSSQKKALIKDACVLISGDGILYAGPHKEAPEFRKHKTCKVIDCSKLVVIPGFVDCNREITKEKELDSLSAQGITTIGAVVSDVRLLKKLTKKKTTHPLDISLLYAGEGDVGKHVTAVQTSTVEQLHVLRSKGHVVRLKADGTTWGERLRGCMSIVGVPHTKDIPIIAAYQIPVILDGKGPFKQLVSRYVVVAGAHPDADTQQTLVMRTLNAASVLGMDTLVGSIDEKKQADILLFPKQKMLPKTLQGKPLVIKRGIQLS